MSDNTERVYTITTEGRPDRTAQFTHEELLEVLASVNYTIGAAIDPDLKLRRMRYAQKLRGALVIGEPDKP